MKLHLNCRKDKIFAQKNTTLIFKEGKEQLNSKRKSIKS